MRRDNPLVVDERTCALFRPARFVNEQVGNPRPDFSAGRRTTHNSHLVLALLIIIHLIHAAPGRAGHVACITASIIKRARSWCIIDNVVHAVIHAWLTAIRTGHVDADLTLIIALVGTGALVDVGAQVLQSQEPVGTRALRRAVDNATVVVASEQLQLAFIAHYFRCCTAAAWSDIKGHNNWPIY